MTDECVALARLMLRRALRLAAVRKAARGGIPFPTLHSTEERMQLPAIHSNGTGKATLLREYRKGVEKVDDAIAALREITTHGRDYYTIGSDAASVAMREHRERLKKLEQVKEELVAIWHHIDQQ